MQENYVNMQNIMLDNDIFMQVTNLSREPDFHEGKKTNLKKVKKFHEGKITYSRRYL